MSSAAIHDIIVIYNPTNNVVFMEYMNHNHLQYLNPPITVCPPESNGGLYPAAYLTFVVITTYSRQDRFIEISTLVYK